MRRLVVVFVVLGLGLSGLLAARLRLQEARAHGPSGGSGEIEGTEVNVSSRLTARVLSWAVREGAQVKRGALLLTLDCGDTQAQLSEAEARLEVARAQAAAASASVEASRRQKEAAAASQLASRAQANALAAQAEAAKRQAQRLESLAEDVAVSNRDQSRASAEGLDQQARAAQAQAIASEGQARAAVASIQASGAQAVAAQAQMKAAEATVLRVRLLVDECQVTAPRDGYVESLPHEPGELVAAGQVLARLVDLSRVKATFYLPNAELAAAHPGGQAEVRADAWPDEVFRGSVLTVSAEAEFTPRNIQTRTDRDRLVYPVEVSLENPGGKLRPGMPVEVQLVAASGGAR